MRGLCSLLSLCLMVMMMVEAVAPVVGVGGASEGENGLLQRVLLLALCIRAIAARQAHARCVQWVSRLLQRANAPYNCVATPQLTQQCRAVHWQDSVLLKSARQAIIHVRYACWNTMRGCGARVGLVFGTPLC